MRTPTLRSASWLQNLGRIRPTDDNEGDDMAVDPSPATGDRNELRHIQLRHDQRLAKGGPVRSVAGGRRGKDDGLIAAQRGEFVVKKKSAKKYGRNALRAVNEGSAKIVMPKRQ